MTLTAPWYRPKRLATLIVLETFLLQAVTPAFAVSTGYTGTISQLPAAYITPPIPNVMFTLDDSLSMYSNAIPDFLTDGGAIDLSGMPSSDDSNAIPTLSGFARQFPDMWGADSEYLDFNYYSNANDTDKHRVGRYMRSSDGNPLYYNRKTRYRPWPLPSDDKNFHPNANVRAVNIHPTDPFNTGYRMDLTVRRGSGSSRYWPATYMVKTSTAALPAANPNSAASTAATFTKVEINSAVTSYNTPRPSDRTDCTTLTNACSFDEELQNFANWLQYYRSRMLMAKGGVAAAFAKQANNLRVGFGTINSPASFGVRTFSGANRTAFYNQMYPVGGSPSGTPLRSAMDAVGKYFQRSDVGNPWAENPQSGSVGTEYSCRRSFHILSTDGFWNGAASSAPGSANNDNFASQFTPYKPDNTTRFAYSNAAGSKWGVYPFADLASNTLADVAAYYWKTDLRPDPAMPNNVAESARDPAFWQHVSSFTVGLGISGSGTVRRQSDNTTTVPAGQPTGHPLKPYEGQPWLSSSAIREWLVANRTEMVWPTPAAGAKTTGDDLVHAAMNSRGRYFSATNPTELANNLASALSEAADNPGDVASVAADAPQLRVGGRLYQATFSPSRWYGRLYAFNQSVSTGQVSNAPTDSTTTNPDQVWEASNKMPAHGSRNIFTFTGAAGGGAAFDWDAGLTTAQKTALGNDRKVLDFVRGDATNEVANGGLFRDRSRYTVAGVTGGVLGDVINGSPIKGPDAGGGYDRLPSSDGSQALYAAFRSGSGLDNMRNTMFLGANDGMLHAFNLVDGVERFGYVPNAAYDVRTSLAGRENKLQLLATDLTGTHRFTVDGPPNVSDAFVGSAWKTVLTASTGAGARGVFALDVTNPAVGGTGFGTGKVMWEFTDANNADMGHVPAYPHVARMVDGTWVVIFGNGYDSTNGQAKLFILKLSDGSVLREIAVGTAGNNGLGQPNLLLNSNREVTAIYAGDLKGNLWKFDTSSSTAASWNAAFSATPLVTVTGPAGTLQPITVMPEITEHPNGGAMITFGTGKLFETGDTATTNLPNVNLDTQSIYGIWDKPSETTGITLTTLTRAALLQVQAAPTFSATATYAASSASAPAFGTQRGWAIDLGSGGERVNLAPQQVKKVLFVVANKPAPADPCGAGGSAKVFVVDPVTGARPTFPVFDVNGDKTFTDAADGGVNIRITRNGLLTQPIFQLPALASFTLPTGVTSSPLTFFDRGQVTAARTGGVELARSSGGNLPAGVPNPCALLMTAALSDTSLETSDMQACGPGGPGGPSSGKARISWRQLQ
jgi:type IV pilus assembly protein PilY1